MNPFWMVLADLRKNLFAQVGVLLLLSFAFSVNIATVIVERGVVDSGVNAAHEYDLVIGAPGSKNDLALASVFLLDGGLLPMMSYEVYEELEHDPRVAYASPFTMADVYQGHRIIGVNEDFYRIRASLVPGEGRVFAAEYEAVVGSDVPLKIGDTFESVHEGAGEDEHEHQPYTVVGKSAATGTPWDKAIVTSYTSLWAIHGHHVDDEEGHEDETHEAGLVDIGHEEDTHEHDEYPDIAAVIVKPADVASAYALRSEYQDNGGRTTSVFPGEVLSYLFGLSGDLKRLIEVLGVLLQVLVSAAVILSLLATLPSKYKWMGLLRTLGAGKGYIFLTLWLQSAFVFFLAGLIGFGVGRLAAELIASMISTSGLTVALTWQASDLVPLVIFWLAGLVGTLIPAAVGFRVSPRKAVLGQ